MDIDAGGLAEEAGKAAPLAAGPLNASVEVQRLHAVVPRVGDQDTIAIDRVYQATRLAGI